MDVANENQVTIEEETIDPSTETVPEQKPAKKKKQRRTRKPSLRSKIRQLEKKLQRVILIAHESIGIINEIDEGAATVEELKNKLRDM